MKKTTLIIYVVLAGLCLLFFVHSCLYFTRNVARKNRDEGYCIIKEYQYDKYANNEARLGVEERYSFVLGTVENSYRDLVFFTIHQNVEVYVDREMVYQMRPSRQNLVGKSPGWCWNKVRLDEEDVGRKVSIVLEPVYKSSIGIKPVFYYGEQYEIGRRIMFGGLPVLLICLTGIAAGLVYIGYTLYNYKNEQLDKSIMMLGCFSLAISIWKLADSQVISFMCPNFPALYILTFLALQLIGPSFILFIKEMLKNRDSKIWYIPIYYSFAVLALTMFMQVTNIRDMRQNLFFIHGGLFLTVAVTSLMVVYEIRTVGWNERLRRNVIFMGISFVSLGVDMTVYYVSKGVWSTFLGMLGAIIYVFASGAFTLRDARELMRIGMEARNFERKAYHDQLTGLLNRAAYAEYVDGEGFSPEQCILAVFDLNNLKKCNDTLGHEKGDVYIKECANMISDAFGDIGNCYRMGGDEFNVLVENVSLSVFKQRIAKLQEMVKERNKKNPEIHMGIAAGYERFDKRMDYDINDTAKRADKMMYAEKAAMKKAEAEKEKAGNVS